MLSWVFCQSLEVDKTIYSAARATCAPVTMSSLAHPSVSACYLTCRSQYISSYSLAAIHLALFVLFASFTLNKASEIMVSNEGNEIFVFSFAHTLLAQYIKSLLLIGEIEKKPYQNHCKQFFLLVLFIP